MEAKKYIQNLTQISEKSIEAVISLFEDSATIPFIARYRKPQTGGLDELQIGAIRDAHKKYSDLQTRKITILGSIEEQGKLHDHLKLKIENCFDVTELEDLYLPFKQKRKTKADVARELGLEPLAKQIIAQRGIDPEEMAERFCNHKLTEVEDALAGARDIIAEWVNENAFVRSKLRRLFERRAVLTSELKKDKEHDGQTFKDYFKHQEPLRHCPSHRFLAIMRGADQGYLTVHALPDKKEALEIIDSIIVKGNGLDAEQVIKAVKDSYTRLMATSLENELLSAKKEQADEEAIQVFAKNLRQLLLAPPLGSKRILAIDPGFKTGCKVVCLSENGSLLHNETIYPHPPQNERSRAMSKITQLVQSYKIDAVAIGNGTAGRETEAFIKHIKFNRDLEVFLVNEDGASIYSASAVAREEFPNHDITVRGSVSIGRRLIDPLSELVKIDAKSLGVGQYQHDVNQTKLKNALDDVVVSAVSSVGVDLNTASSYLLQYVSGLSTNLADKIVDYRNEKGNIQSREELLSIPRFGKKAFEQSAGFLRIRNGQNPLDSTAVHPESYATVKDLASKNKVSINEMIGNESLLSQLAAVHNEDIELQEIISELRKPNLDPRKKAKVLNFSDAIKTISHLKIGLTLPGIVTNVTNFGAFVDIGIKENGLIHKPHLSDGYVDNPSDYIHLHEHVEVEILTIDEGRKRIGLKLVRYLHV
jgi:uncharacterized protein